MNLTQTQLAKAAGVSQSTIVRWGKASLSPVSADLAAICAVASTLGVRVEWLITGSGAKSDYPGDTYPARKIAVDFATLDGVRARAIDHVRTLNTPRHAALRPSQWLVLIQAAEAEEP